jgi:polar amino acid transport system substrate-binding protein
MTDQNIDTSLITAFAPTGRLRACINIGNRVLANRMPQTGEVGGVSVDLAHALAKRLGVPLEPVVFTTARQSVEALEEDRADIGFFAIDPARARLIAFTAPYVLIEGVYLVPGHSPIHGNEEVDQPGNRVVVGQGTAYDLFLTRELKSAQLVRTPNSQTVVDTFLAEGCEAAAGVRQQIESDAAKHPELRVLGERFMVIRQAMGVATRRGPEAAYLHAFVEEMKTAGYVAECLRAHDIEGASVAPAGDPPPAAM